METTYHSLLQANKIKQNFIYQLACVLTTDVTKIQHHYKYFESYPETLKKIKGYAD